jgi:hypothetical protein
VTRRDRQARWEIMPKLRNDHGLQRLANCLVTGSRSAGKKNSRQNLDYDPERIRIDIAVAVEPVFKCQGLRSLPWGVRRSLCDGSRFRERQPPWADRYGIFSRSDLGQPLQRPDIDAAFRQSSPTTVSSTVPRNA